MKLLIIAAVLLVIVLVVFVWCALMIAKDGLCDHGGYIPFDDYDDEDEENDECQPPQSE